MITSPHNQWLRRRRLGRRLIYHHAVLALVSLALGMMIYFAVPGDDTIFRTSMASAYVGLILLGATLLISPWNVFRRRPNPVSIDLRRDLGIWAGLLGVLHTVVGLRVHFRGHMWNYFVDPPNHLHRISLRRDPFGLANYMGLAATLSIALLLALSNDLSLRTLGTKRWKALQRLNYGLLALVALHGIVYQMLEKRDAGWVLVLGTTVVVVTVIQLAAFWRGRLASSRERTVGRSTEAQ